MLKGLKRRGLSAAVIAAAFAAASCATDEPAPPPPPPPPPPPALSLNDGVAQAASIYVAFMREVASIPPGGFQDAESIQAAIRKGAAYEPGQLSRGMIAYGSILALQSPEFVQGVRAYANDATTRQDMIARISADPFVATTLPGADKAAGLMIDAIGRDSTAMLNIANAVEADAYTIQERRDPRRRWSTVHIQNREVRLESAKSLSGQSLLPSAEDSARLFAAAHAGSGLGVAGDAINGPYTRPVAQALAIAALAALGAGGDDNRVGTEAFTHDQASEFCLQMSKLMLFQCLAAARPSYEDMFCLGRHVARDLATCSSQNLSPGGVVVPSTPQPSSEPVQTAATPVQTPAT